MNSVLIERERCAPIGDPTWNFLAACSATRAAGDGYFPETLVLQKQSFHSIGVEPERPGDPPEQLQLVQTDLAVCCGDASHCPQNKLSAFRWNQLCDVRKRANRDVRVAPQRSFGGTQEHHVVLVEGLRADEPVKSCEFLRLD